MSDRIRAMREPSPQERKRLERELMIANGIDPDTQAEYQDYLNGPSMASILLKQAKMDLMRDLLGKSREDGTEQAMAPMIASITQLDRQ